MSTSPLENSFDNSRSADILETATALAGGREAIQASGNLPLETKCLLILILKMGLSLEFPGFPGSASAETLNKFIWLILPELRTPEGKATYERIAQVFIRDMKDLKNGKL